MRKVSDALAMYGSDVDLAQQQQRAYAKALGCEIVWIEAEDDLADCCFIEDTAIVENGRALLTNMGFPERRLESYAVRDKLKQLGFEITEMRHPATLDGGDVLRIGDAAFVGLSGRTNEAGAAALEEFLGRPCTRVPVRRCLHLKSGVTAISDNAVLLHPDRIDPTAFDRYRILEADDPSALLLPDKVLVASHENADRVPGAVLLDVSEFQQADGGLTCLSILL